VQQEVVPPFVAQLEGVEYILDAIGFHNPAMIWNQDFPKFLAFTVSQRWRKPCTNYTMQIASGQSAQ
jgi:hypothetical protein